MIEFKTGMNGNEMRQVGQNFLVFGKSGVAAWDAGLEIVKAAHAYRSHEGAIFLVGFTGRVNSWPSVCEPACELVPAFA